MMRWKEFVTTNLDHVIPGQKRDVDGDPDGDTHGNGDFEPHQLRIPIDSDPVGLAASFLRERTPKPPPLACPPRPTVGHEPPGIVR